MKNLTFGIEIELTGISREKAAKTVANILILAPTTSAAATTNGRFQTTMAVVDSC